MIRYLTDRNGVVEIRAIPAQPVAFGSPLEAFQRVLVHEQSVTEAYRQAYEAAVQAQDYQTLVIIQDFLREQIDEVAQSVEIVGRLQIANTNPGAILLVDQELGGRETEPAALGTDATTAD